MTIIKAVLPKKKGMGEENTLGPVHAYDPNLSQTLCGLYYRPHQLLDQGAANYDNVTCPGCRREAPGKDPSSRNKEVGGETNA